MTVKFTYQFVGGGGAGLLAVAFSVAFSVALFANCNIVTFVDAPDAEETPDVTVDDGRLRCGAEPYVLAKILITTTVREPLAGITFTSPMCPGVSQVSGDDGLIEGYVTKSVPFYARFDGDGYAALLSSEQKYKGDNSLTVPMLPRFITGVLPDYDSKRGAILISLPKNPKVPAPCTETDGVRITVKDRPDARILYFAEGVIPTVMEGAKETSKAGLVAVLDLDAGQMVTITGKKKGCTVSFTELGATGRAPLEAERITLMAGAVLPPPPPPDGGVDASADADLDGSIDGEVPDAIVDDALSDATDPVDADPDAAAIADADPGADAVAVVDAGVDPDAGTDAAAD